VIGVWQANNMSGRYSGCKCVCLWGASGEIIRNHFGFGVGVFGGEIEVVRAREDGEDRTVNLAVLLLAELDCPDNRWT
jgi:hypothetical protein